MIYNSVSLPLSLQGVTICYTSLPAHQPPLPPPHREYDGLRAWVGMGTGTGWQITTPEKPAPVARVWRVWQGCVICLLQD